MITTGLAHNYFLENLEDLRIAPSHLHVGAYPLPVEKIRQLAEHVERVLVLEEGQPFLERRCAECCFRALRFREESRARFRRMAS